MGVWSEGLATVPGKSNAYSGWLVFSTNQGFLQKKGKNGLPMAVSATTGGWRTTVAVIWEPCRVQVCPAPTGLEWFLSGNMAQVGEHDE